MIYQFSKNERSSDLAHSFNIWSPAQYFVTYGDHLLFEWYMDGLIGEQYISDFLIGGNDRTLAFVKQVPVLRGGFPTISTWISLDVLCNRTASIRLDTGQTKFSNRGEISQYNYSATFTYNGTQAWPAMNYINSTLDTFNNPLSNSADITVFSQDQLRNLWFNPLSIQTELQFSVNYMAWSTKNFLNDSNYDSTLAGLNNLTRFRGFPLLASLPYFNQSSPLLTQSTRARPR